MAPLQSKLQQEDGVQKKEEFPPELIVISGMAGRFPDSDNIHSFRDNLFNKVDLVSGDERRWLHTHAEIPQRTGKVNHIEKFDAGFFGVHQRQAHTMDPMCRILLEHTFEAVLDAGINPKELQGTNTGVFIGACFSESEKTSFYDNLDPEKYGITGCSRSMLAQRISYWFQLQGRSFIADTACSSSSFALEHAYRAIKQGACNMAIVGGCNLCLQPMVSLQFARLGVLSLDGSCKSFDNLANGYARSEAISVVILQKANDARRIYAEIIHSKTNCDGYKEQGITYPSGKIQKVLLEDFYKECGVNPASLTYVEAHGTGTKVGDPEELGTLDEIFCKDRDHTLLIGSVKSNIGHNEAISGLCSVVKVLLAFETGIIPPNINYNTPRQGVHALENGKMKVVSEKTPLPDNNGVIGINSFGFGGANSHSLLHWNTKLKVSSTDALPRLICLSGRTKEALEHLMDHWIDENGYDHEFIGLMQKAFEYSIPGHCYRGFLVVTQQGILARSVKKSDDDPKPLQIVFGDVEKYLKFGKHLFNIPMFATHVKRVQNILRINNLLESEVDTNLGSFILYTGLGTILKKLGLDIRSYWGANLAGQKTIDYLTYKMTLEECLKEIIAPSFKTSDLNQSIREENSNTLIVGSPRSREDFSLFNPQVDSIISFLVGLGNLYQHGYDLTLENLYPKIHWPVGRSTRMISPLIKWDHSQNWSVTVYKAEDVTKTGQRTVKLSLRDDEWSFLTDHVIDGRCLFPATAYLVLVWETLARVVGRLTSDMKIVFENVKFLRASTVPIKGQLQLILNIRKGTGHFEIVEGGTQVVTGRIYEEPEMSAEWELIKTPPEPLSPLEILLEKDIYKELRLRGYNYQGHFRGLKMCSVDGTMGAIQWTGNWILLMDCMLQMQIMSEDTRNLYVPTRISRILIDSAKHITTAKSYVRNSDEHPNVPVYFHRDLNVIRCGGIEVRGLWASAIVKRQQAEPVLETYRFAPYISERPQELEEVVRQFVQIALENEPVTNLKSIEVLGEKNIKNGYEEVICLSQFVKLALEDQPVVKSQLIVLTNRNIDVGLGISVENKKINSEVDCYLGISHGGSNSFESFNQWTNVLKPNGFLISIEDKNWEETQLINNLKAISVLSTENYKLVLLRFDSSGSSTMKPKELVQITTNMSWFHPLQKKLSLNDTSIILWTNDPQSGILGLVNCLRREPNLSGRITMLWVPPSIKQFTLDDPHIKEQLAKNLSINILQDDKSKKWGSYRHFKLPASFTKISVEHRYVNVTTRGDLSTLKWIQGHMTSSTILQPEEKLVYVYYSSINFRDVMTSMGRIQPDVVTRNRLIQDCIQGIEYSGKTSEGIRVMGMLTRKAMASIVAADVNLLWKVPDDWSMKDAVTIPAVYGTVLYGLVFRAGLKKRESILIHSGTGGVGHAAIHVANYHECDIFVTVGTQEKRSYIRKTFPFIKDTHIGSSRDLSFVQMINKETNYKGVDLVLNSLAGDKLQASVQCLKKGGRFIEIGKYDLDVDSRLSLDLISKEAEYHGLMLDSLIEFDPIAKRILHKLLQEGIDLKYIKPIPMTAFKEDQLEEAFRYMATGKHLGKVVIEVRPQENEITTPKKMIKFKAQARFYCFSDKVYLINGGLGGFGLELIDWLVLRGARNIVVNSRRGLSSSYQRFRLNIWKNYGVTIKICIEDASTLKGCQCLLNHASSNGPIAAIFNLAVILKDALFENQTLDQFQTVMNPKAIATQHLDILSRTLCPELEQFVIFSSVSCGRGNAGQTNYGLANSIMERICEQRRKDNLPGLAIQWGAIGDVGLVADMQEKNTELVIGGTLQQKISSCLDALDGFLRQNNPIVSSMVVAEKKTGSGGANNIVDAVVNILGLRDLRTVSHHSTLPELGMDSMMAVEIKQTLEREYDVFLSPEDIRRMTFSMLQEIALQKHNGQEDVAKELPRGVKVLLRFIANETEADIPLVQMVHEKCTNDEKLILLPGIEGMATLFNPMIEYLRVNTICTQFCYTDPEDTIFEMAQNQVEILKKLLKTRFCIAGHSFGSAVGLEIVSQLEKLGFKGTLILLDGAPALMRDLIRSQLVVSTEAEFQTSLLCSLMSVFLPFDIILKYKQQMLQCYTYEQRIDVALGVAPKQLPHRPEYMKKVFNAVYKRMKAIYNYVPSFDTLESKVYLFRANSSSMLDIQEDYGLGQIVGQEVEVRLYDGNHVSILENKKLIQDIETITKETFQREEQPVGKMNVGIVQELVQEDVSRPILIS